MARFLLEEAGGLLQMICCKDHSLWRFTPVSDAVEEHPPPASADRGAMVIERNAVRDFVQAGGASADTPADLTEWKYVFVRRRVTHAKAMVRSAIAGTLDANSSDQDGLQHVRKKDLPDPTDKVGVRRLLTSHSLQQSLVAQRTGRGRRRRVVATAASGLTGALVFNAPKEPPPLSRERRQSVVASGGDLEALDRPVRRPRQRVILDDLASPRECALAIGAAVVGMDVNDAEAAAHGESVVIVSPPSAVRGLLGEGTTRLVSLLCWRVLSALRREFAEDRPLHLAGAMLTRTQPPRPAKGPPTEYDYGVAHVDRANMASYDYSAVLYLNTQSRGFDGGEFAFVDAAEDAVLEPRAGRCVLFASGFEQLHRVEAVTRGSRFVLASWYTLTPASGDALYRAEYEVHSTAPPPTAAEAEVEGLQLEALVKSAGGTLADLEALVASQ